MRRHREEVMPPLQLWRSGQGGGRPNHRTRLSGRRWISAFSSCGPLWEEKAPRYWVMRRHREEVMPPRQSWWPVREEEDQTTTIKRALKGGGGSA